MNIKPILFILLPTMFLPFLFKGNDMHSRSARTIKRCFDIVVFEQFLKESYFRIKPCVPRRPGIIFFCQFSVPNNFILI